MHSQLNQELPSILPPHCLSRNARIKPLFIPRSARVLQGRTDRNKMAARRRFGCHSINKHQIKKTETSVIVVKLMVLHPQETTDYL